MKLLTSCLLAAVLAMPAAAQVKADVALRAAMERETVQGDLKGAIEQYKKIVASFAGNRPVAAQALFHMGQCYEKLGDQQARQAYERLVRDYPDQQETVASARAKLSGLGTAAVRRLPIADGVDGGWCVSPDGRFAAFADGAEDESDLALMNLATGERKRLTHAASKKEGVEGCLFSPDGKQIAYIWSGEAPPDHLRVIKVDGTGERTLYTYPSLAIADWVSESIIGELDNSSNRQQSPRLAAISAIDGSLRVLRTGGPWTRGIHASPDGRWLVSSEWAPARTGQHDLSLTSIADGHSSILVQQEGDNCVIGWTPDGKSVLFTTDKDITVDLYSLRLEGGKAAGSPVLIRRNIGVVAGRQVAEEGTARWAGAISARRVTAQGALYYHTWRQDTMNVFTASLDPETGMVGSPALATRRNFGTNDWPDWSPDGSTIAYRTNQPFHFASSAQLKGNWTLSFLDVTSGAVQDIALKLVGFSAIRWRPDGNAILVQGQSEPGKQGFFLLDPKTQETKVIARMDAGSKTGLEGPLWMPDGKSILYASEGAILQRTSEGGETKELYRSKDLAGPSMALSADGQRVAFLSGDALMVMPAGGGEPRTILRLQSPEKFATRRGIAWMRNGRQILFAKHAPATRFALPISLWRVSVDGGEPVNTGLDLGALDVWSKHKDDLRINSITVDPSGRRVAFSVGPTDTTQAWVLEGLTSKP